MTNKEKMLLINTAKMINKLAEMERLSAEAHLGLSEALNDKDRKSVV